jgi:hypothetical protein
LQPESDRPKGATGEGHCAQIKPLAKNQMTKKPLTKSFGFNWLGFNWI